jgi:hypothetical protein
LVSSGTTTAPHVRLLRGTLRSDQPGGLDAYCPTADQAAWIHTLLPPAD